MRTTFAVAVLFGAVLLGTGQSHAQSTYWLKASTNADWNVATNWATTQGGTTSPTTGDINASNFFDLDGKTLGTPNAQGATFNGGTIISPTGSGLLMRTGSGGNKNISNLTVTGTTTISSDNSFTLSISSKYTASGTTRLSNVSGTGGTTVQALTMGTLTGNGEFQLLATQGANPGVTKTSLLTITTGTGFTGNITWATDNTNKPILKFGNDVNLGGGLIATDTYSRIDLDRNVTFASVTLNGTSLAVGFYDFTNLNTNYGAIFNDGFTGSITVVGMPEPSTLAAMAFAGLPLLSRRRRRM